MNHMRLWLAAGIIAVVVVGGFILSVPHTRDVKETSPAVPQISVPVVSLHDSYKKGLHTIIGSLPTPNACTQISATASLEGASSTPSILVAISMPEDSGVCLQVPTTASFKTTLAAPAHLPLAATVNGVTASTTSS